MKDLSGVCVCVFTLWCALKSAELRPSVEDPHTEGSPMTSRKFAFTREWEVERFEGL